MDESLISYPILSQHYSVYVFTCFLLFRGTALRLAVPADFVLFFLGGGGGLGIRN